MGLLNHKEDFMNLYEMMFIMNPDIGDEEQEKLITRFKNTIGKNKGDVIRFDDMGLKSLSYKIQKKLRGHYFLVYLEGPGALVAEVERFFKLDENIIRFVIVKLEKRITRQDLEPKAEPQPEPVPAAEPGEVGV
jgi:small subunit ribosomal protein S6